MKLIKGVYFAKYEVELFIDQDDMYHVKYASLLNVGGRHEIMTEYKTADFLFDRMLEELGGH